MTYDVNNRFTRESAWATLLSATSEMTPAEIWEADPSNPGFQQRIANQMMRWGGADVPFERVASLAESLANFPDASQEDLRRKMSIMFNIRPDFFNFVRDQKSGSKGVAVSSRSTAAEAASDEPSAQTQPAHRAPEHEMPGMSVSFAPRSAPYSPLKWMTGEPKSSFVPFSTRYTPVEWETLRVAQHNAEAEEKKAEERPVFNFNRGVTYQPVQWAK